VPDSLDELFFPIDDYLKRVEDGLAMVTLFDYNLEHFGREILDKTPWYLRWKPTYRLARRIDHENLKTSRASLEQAWEWGIAAKARGCMEVFLTWQQKEFLLSWKLQDNLIRRAAHFPPPPDPYR